MRLNSFLMTGLFSAGTTMLALAAHARTSNEQLANPASEYCGSIGGTSFGRRTPSGEIGYCRLPGGKVVEEWKLFRESLKHPVPRKPRHDAYMANPAAVHCSDIGGTNVDRKTPQGDLALCRLPDGKTVDAWDLYRRDDDKERNRTRPARVGLANPASGYCIRQKGRLEMREGPGGTTGYCHLPDGRTVEEWQLYRQSAIGHSR